MAAIKFPEGMPDAPSVFGNDKIMMADAVTNNAKSVSFDKVKDYLTITNVYIEPITSGALPTPPAGQIRIMEIVGGNDGSTWTHSTLPGGTTSLLPYQTAELYWNGTAWSLKNVQTLPTIPVKNESGESTTEAISQKFATDLDKNKAGVENQDIIIDRGNIKSFPSVLNSELMRADGTTSSSDTLTYSLEMSGLPGDVVTFSYAVRYVTAFINGVASLADGAGQSGSSDPSGSISTYTFRPNVTSIIVTVVKAAVANLVINAIRTTTIKTLDDGIILPQSSITDVTNPLYRGKDNLITAQDTDFTEDVEGEYYFVRNAVEFDNPVGQGAMNAEGVVGTPGTYAHTKKIPVVALQKIEFNSLNRYVTAFVNGVAVRALGAGMSGSLDPSTDIRTYIVPDTVTEIVASPQLAQVNNFQVNIYQYDKLQKFKHPAPADSVSNIAINNFTAKNQLRTPDVSIAPTLYGLTGSQISVYSDSTIKYWRDYRGYSDVELNTTQVKLDRVSQTTLTSNVVGNKIRLANEYFEIIKEENFNIVASNINNTTAKKVMLIGSSTTAQGYFLDYILDSPAKTGITFLGTKKTYNNTVANRVNAEGRAGQTLAFYMTVRKTTADHNPFMQPSGVYKYYGVTGFWAIVKANQTPGGQYQGYAETVVIFGSNGYLISPNVNDVMYDNSLSQFKCWDGTAWVNIAESTLSFSFNIPKYLSTWNIETPDIVHVLLGSNDFMNLNENESVLAWTAYKNNLETLIASFKSANTNVKVILGIPFSSGQQGVYGVFEQERRKRSNWIFSSKTIENYKNKESNGIYIADYNALVDRENAYLDTQIDPYVNYDGINRVDYIADPVHLSNNGAKNQLGLAFTAIIQYLRTL